MITAVLDSNILASGAIATVGTLATIISAWHRGEFELLVSAEIVAELGSTLRKPYFCQRFTLEQAARFQGLLKEMATPVPIAVEVHGVATHPEDDLILATAVSAQADYLVTGDDKLRQLGAFRGVAIVSPREFLGILEAHRPEMDEG